MVRLPFQHFFIKNKSCTFTIYIPNSRIALQGYYLTAGNLSEKFQYSTFSFLPQFKSKNSFNNSYFNTLYRPDMTIDLGVYICTDLLQSDVRMMLCSYCYNPGQSKSELSNWSSITIGKLPPPPYVPQLFRAIQAIQYYVNCTVRRKDKALTILEAS